MAEQLRELVALTVDLVSVPGTHMMTNDNP